MTRSSLTDDEIDNQNINVEQLKLKTLVELQKRKK